MQTGVWYKKNHVRQTRLKGFMKQICEITGIDLKNRKITNHGGRKTMIRILEELGVPRNQILLQSRHHTLDGLKSYVLP